MDSGYTIYALNKRYSALAQVLNSKSKTYVDAEGKLIKLDRDKYHRTTIHKVLGYDVTHSGSYLMYTKRDSFVTTQLSNYVVTIRFDGTDILVQQVNDPKEARKGYKI